jgi:hypothetical protein
MSHDLRVDARRQLGCFTHSQARSAGTSEREIERRVEVRAWEEVAPGVYRALPAAPISREQRLMALTLSVDGVAFGRSAAWLYGLLPAPEHPEVLVVRASRNRLRDGLHSTRSLPTAEVARVKGIQATIPARTVIDAAGTVSQRPSFGSSTAPSSVASCDLRRCGGERSSSRTPSGRDAEGCCSRWPRSTPSWCPLVTSGRHSSCGWSTRPGSPNRCRTTASCSTDNGVSSMSRGPSTG